MRAKVTFVIPNIETGTTYEEMFEKWATRRALWFLGVDDKHPEENLPPGVIVYVEREVEKA